MTISKGVTPINRPRRGKNETIDGPLDRLAGILVDWDGCVAIGDRLLPPALAFLQRHGDRVAIVSNNSTHLPEDFSNLLKARGVVIPPERILLAGAEAVAMAAQRALPTLLLGSVRLSRLALRLRLPLTRDEAKLVVLLRDTRFTYRKLERAANALHQGANLIVANPDATHPGPGGSLTPETGALLAALSACLDLGQRKVEIIGKPAPSLFLKACAALRVAPADALMVGDNPATDIAGARALGMATLLAGPAFDFTPQAIADQLRLPGGEMPGERAVGLASA